VKSLTLLSATLSLIFAASSLAITQQPAQQPDNDKCSVPIYTGKDLDRKPQILAKPEPEYSREDRRKYASEVTTLRAVLCGSGEVLNIKVISGLDPVIDAKTIAAARKIRFIPGEKDGVKVSRPVTLKYYVSLQ
jgi:Gram-negative bacterial TonB protein C-terminal